MANEQETNNINDLIFQQEIEALFQELEQNGDIDKYEAEIPNLGMVQMEDQETGASFLVNTASKKVRKNYQKNYQTKLHYFSDSFKKSGAGALECRIDESDVKTLWGYVY